MEKVNIKKVIFSIPLIIIGIIIFQTLTEKGNCICDICNIFFIFWLFVIYFIYLAIIYLVIFKLDSFLNISGNKIPLFITGIIIILVIIIVSKKINYTEPKKEIYIQAVAQVPYGIGFYLFVDSSFKITEGREYYSCYYKGSYSIINDTIKIESKDLREITSTTFRVKNFEIITKFIIKKDEGLIIPITDFPLDSSYYFIIQTEKNEK